MIGLGLLGDVRPADWLDPETVTPARPGSEAPSTLVTVKRQSSSSNITALVTQAAEVARDQAKRVALENPTSTTAAALAQSHAVLNERDEAIAAARRAVELSASGRSGMAVGDPVSLRLAAEVLLRFGETRDAYDSLRRAIRPRSLRVMFAMLAFQAGDTDVALDEIADLSDPLAEAIKGYMFAIISDYPRAIRHLRAALREQPEDPDSLLNLSIALGRMGSRRKATAAALRATRVAPGRKDLSLHYLNLLLVQGAVTRVDDEIRSLKAQDVIVDADLLVIKARALIAMGQHEKAIPILRTAAEEAKKGADHAARGEILGNLAVLRFETNRITYAYTVKELEALLKEFPGCESIVVQYGRFANTAAQAPLLRRVVEQLSNAASPHHLAFLHHQVALLEGDNDAAAAAARDWFAHERGNPMAAATAIVALGIGVEMWEEASLVARDALARFPSDEVVINNGAYVLAMAGYPQEAIEILKPMADGAFFMKATLGLAYLANGSIDEGMRLYREAADEAEVVDPVWRSLMTSYQALVVRQLGLIESQPESIIAALSLEQVNPPADWRNRPEFLRLWSVAKRNGYGWPLAL